MIISIFMVRISRIINGVFYMFDNCIIDMDKILGKRLITARFLSGEEVEYTTDVLDLLKTDKDVEWVVDSLTGEVLYSKYDRS